MAAIDFIKYCIGNNHPPFYPPHSAVSFAHSRIIFLKKMKRFSILLWLFISLPAYTTIKAQVIVQHFQKDNWIVKVSSHIDLRSTATLFLGGKYDFQLGASYLGGEKDIQLSVWGGKLIKKDENTFSFFPLAACRREL